MLGRAQGILGLGCFLGFELRDRTDVVAAHDLARGLDVLPESAPSWLGSGREAALFPHDPLAGPVDGPVW
jgi:hypothetical protein